MTRFNINAMYEYEAEIEANTEAEAYDLFLADLNTYYVGAYSIDIDELEEDEDDEE